MLKECNDLETNMVVGQIQSTAMGLLRASGTACVLLAGDAKAREEEFKRAASARGLNRSSTFRNYKTTRTQVPRPVERRSSRDRAVLLWIRPRPPKHRAFAKLTKIRNLGDVLIFFGWHRAGARSSVEELGIKEHAEARRRIARDHARTKTVDAAKQHETRRQLELCA